MSENSNSSKIPTSAKLAMALACLAVAVLIGGPGVFLWVAAALGASLFYLFKTWPFFLLVLAMTSSFGAWTAQVNRRSLMAGALRYASYTILIGSALYLAMAVYTLISYGMY